MPVRNGHNDDPLGSGGGGWRWGGFVGCLLGCVSIMAASEDDYLNQIQSEAHKVEVESGAGTAASLSAEAKADMLAFERELERHYRSSYLFYKKLLGRSQEEIFTEYAQGASIAGIRKKIMNRFLHDK